MHCQIFNFFIYSNHKDMDVPLTMRTYIRLNEKVQWIVKIVLQSLESWILILWDNNIFRYHSGFFFRYDYLGEISKWLMNYSQRLPKFLTTIKNSHNFSNFGQIITRRRNLFWDFSCFYHEIKKSRFWLQWSISLEYVLVY